MRVERQKIRVRSTIYGLGELPCGMTLGEIRDEVVELIKTQGESLILQCEAPSCGTCENDDIEVEVNAWVERDETDEELAKRTRRLEAQREAQESRERMELARLKDKYEPAPTVMPLTAAIVGGLSEEQHEALCDALDGKPEGDGHKGGGK